MKLIRFGEFGQEKPGLLLEGRRIDASGAFSDYDEAFFAEGGLERLRRWMQQEVPSALRVPDNVRWDSPVARPSKPICIGLNFSDHTRESGAAPPEEPVIFFKATSAIVGPHDDVILPLGNTKTDWEVELGIVIGRRATHVAKEEAVEYVAGYLLHNDYSERTFQLERAGQWVKDKSCNTFAPMGPFLVTRDEINDVHDLSMWLTVNGRTRQRGSTADMIFDVPTLVSYLSRFMSLLPGDIISAGTPAGVGLGLDPPQYLKAGVIR